MGGGSGGLVHSGFRGAGPLRFPECGGVRAQSRIVVVRFGNSGYRRRGAAKSRTAHRRVRRERAGGRTSQIEGRKRGRTSPQAGRMGSRAAGARRRERELDRQEAAIRRQNWENVMNVLVQGAQAWVDADLASQGYSGISTSSGEGASTRVRKNCGSKPYREGDYCPNR